MECLGGNGPGGRLHERVEHRRDDDADDGPGVGEGAAEPSGRLQLRTAGRGCPCVARGCLDGDIESARDLLDRGIEQALVGRRLRYYVHEALIHSDSLPAYKNRNLRPSLQAVCIHEFTMRFFRELRHAIPKCVFLTEKWRFLHNLYENREYGLRKWYFFFRKSYFCRSAPGHMKNEVFYEV